MSIFYDLQKWTMLTLASIAITMIVGLVLMQYAHGQEELNNESTIEETNNKCDFSLEMVLMVRNGTIPTDQKEYWYKEAIKSLEEDLEKSSSDIQRSESANNILDDTDKASDEILKDSKKALNKIK
jgi:hypothetical protein